MLAAKGGGLNSKRHKLGALYFLISGVVFIGAVSQLIVGVFLFGTGPDLESTANYLFCCAIAALSVWFFRRGLRATQPSAEDVLQEDERPPVLYLRSFEHDSQTRAVSDHKLGMPDFLPDPRAEDTIAPLLNTLGPMIALGRPGEKLPETGAYRLYVNDDERRDKVRELLAKAKLVVLLADAETADALWEVQTCLEMLRPEQLVLYFPFKPKVQEQVYSRFRDATRTYFPKALPENLDDGVFMKFGENWSPQLVHGTSKNRAKSDYEALLKIVSDLTPNFKPPSSWSLLSTPKKFAIIGIALIWFVGIVAIIYFGLRGLMNDI